MSFKEFVKSLEGDRIEGELVKSVAYSLLASLAMFFVAYYFRLRFVEGIISKFGFFIFFAIASYALLVPTIRQVRAYKQFGCMSGMMIGMTIGMIAGFLVGFYIGATNGMFIGGVFGMFIGVVLGIWMGSCCGIMGFMEGVMAGFMGGWMGAMTSVMLLNDHLRAATAIIFGISAVIMVSLNYMIYQETKETEQQRQEDHMVTIIVSIILTAVTVWFMVFGPRSALFA